MNPANAIISPVRLRIGIVLVALFWIPVWFLAPAIARVFGLDGDTTLIVVIVVQSVLGILGVLVAGREVARIMKGVHRKQLLPTVWAVLRSGEYDRAP